MAIHLKCGCVFDGKSFVKHCREHALMVLRKRAEKYGFGQSERRIKDKSHG